MMNWFRWHTGTSYDAKWRTISRLTGVPVHAIVAIWATMKESASDNQDARGTMSGWKAEDVGSALDLTTEQVQAVYDAMQGRTLDGNVLRAWHKRNPIREREDDSNERVKRHREKKKAKQNHVTPRNTKNDLDKTRLEEIRGKGKEGGEAGSSADASVDSVDGRDLAAVMFKIWQDNRGKELPAVMELTETRRKKCRARLKQNEYRTGEYLTLFMQAVAKAAKSPFCTGKNDRGWKLSFDFLIENDTNMMKLLEGKYEDGNRRTGHQAFTSGDVRDDTEFGHLFEDDPKTTV